jgi:hypothetical protein
VFFDLVAFYRTGRLNGATKQQEFFRKGSFTGVRVRDNCKSASFMNLVVVFHCFIICPEASYSLENWRKGNAKSGKLQSGKR